MKSYTDLEQSKVLAEILPIESADMFFSGWAYPKELHLPTFSKTSIKDSIPCWSLAALLDAIPYNVSFNKAVYRFKLVKFFNHWECYHENFGTVSTEIFKAENSVDACYDMILKLNELNLL